MHFRVECCLSEFIHAILTKPRPNLRAIGNPYRAFEHNLVYRVISARPFTTAVARKRKSRSGSGSKESTQGRDGAGQLDINAAFRGWVNVAGGSPILSGIGMLGKGKQISTSAMTAQSMKEETEEAKKSHSLHRLRPPAAMMRSPLLDAHVGYVFIFNPD